MFEKRAEQSDDFEKRQEQQDEREAAELEAVRPLFEQESSGFGWLMDAVFQMSKQPAFQGVATVVSFAVGMYSDQRKQEALDAIARDVATIRRLVENLPNIIREAIAWHAIYAFEARIWLANT